MMEWIRALETTEGGWSAFAAAEEAGLMAVEGGAVAAASTVAAPAILAGGAALGLVAVAGTLWHNANHAAQPSAAADLTRTLVHGHTNTGIEQLNGHNGVVQGTASGFQALPYWLQPIPQTVQALMHYDDTDPVTMTPSSSRGHSLATQHISASQERGRGRERGRQGRSRTRDMASTIAYPTGPRAPSVVAPASRAASAAPTIAYPSRAASEAPTILYRTREEDEDATPFESHAAKRMKRSTSAPIAVRPRMRPHPRAKLVKSQPLKIPKPKGKAKAKAKSAASSSGGLPFASTRDVGPLGTTPKDVNGK